MSRSLDTQFERQAANLIEFLQNDLDLSFTMLKSAKLSTHPEHRRAALERVHTAIVSIRRLQGRVTDPEAWKAIQDRLDHLEREFESMVSPVRA